MNYQYRVGLCYRAGLIATGAVCAGLGMAVTVALSMHRIALVQVLPGSAPMPPVAALAFVLCGAGLAGIGLWYPMAVSTTAVAAVALALGAAAERILSSSYVIESRLASAMACPECAFPMAPNTIVCILLAGVALMVRQSLPRIRNGYMAVGMLGSVVFAIGSTAVFGYVTGFPLYAWSAARPMSLLSSLECVLLGLGVIMSVWRYSEMDETGMPRWFPLLLGSGALTTNLCMLRALRLGANPTDRHVVSAGLFLLLGGLLTFLFSAQAFRMRRLAPVNGPDLRVFPGTAVTGEMLNDFFRVYPEPACLIGLDGSVRAANALWENAFRLPPGEAARQSLMHLLAPEDHAKAAAALEKLRAGQQTVALDCQPLEARRSQPAYLVFRAVDSGAIVTLARRVPSSA